MANFDVVSFNVSCDQEVKKRGPLCNKGGNWGGGGIYYKNVMRNGVRERDFYITNG